MSRSSASQNRRCCQPPRVWEVWLPSRSRPAKLCRLHRSPPYRPRPRRLDYAQNPATPRLPGSHHGLGTPGRSGGLAAGTATIAKHLHPDIKVIGVEPHEGADTLLSMRCGQRIALPEAPAAIADGLGHTSPSPLTWAVNSRLLDAVVTVTDQDITTAMAFAFRHLKVVAEPSGACALAAVLAGLIPTSRG
ncbi:pyridoxal-phosphate dependent enzyme [Streptomyces sp. NBC_01445]|uniref:pyridoxal-phosphate dependent enzyme n=1 Tax=Streptomyces sp. NBC_01445 TaxID=2903869 RepID=UPI002DDC0BD8|nr:pyridoxal-phosphate dependent enzyme [Streptomyces sp. NBC_01445]